MFLYMWHLHMRFHLIIHKVNPRNHTEALPLNHIVDDPFYHSSGRLLGNNLDGPEEILIILLLNSQSFPKVLQSEGKDFSISMILHDIQFFVESIGCNV